MYLNFTIKLNTYLNTQNLFSIESSYQSQPFNSLKLTAAKISNSDPLSAEPF